MPFSYANPTSGPSAGGIGWFNFENLSMNPGDIVNGLTGTLSNGNIVTFDIALKLLSGTPRTFNATPLPTYPSAQFGVAGYTGIVGNAAMYAAVYDGTVAVSLFTISNITVKTPDNIPVPNYSVLIADAESTNLYEGIKGLTDGESWELFASVGNTNAPNLSGIGTQTFDIVGNQQSGPQIAYVLKTQAPQTILLTVTDLDPVQTRQGFCLGFATTRVALQKNIGQRINPADQFDLSIAGTPSDQVTTTGSTNGIQTEIAKVYASPGNAFNLNESMTAGSQSALSDYILTVSAANATPAGSVPPITALPIQFIPALGDDITYTFLNASPEVFTKEVDKAYADLGETLTYTVTVNNPNNFAINNILVNDQIPAGTSYAGNLTVSAPYTGVDPQSGITITTIAPASSVTLSWQVLVDSMSPISNPIPNYASITVPDGASGITNVVTTQINTAFVSALKTVDKNFAATGDILTYTINLKNDGNVSANNVVITDTIPTGTTFVAGSVTGATGVPPTLTLTNSIPAGGSAIVTFQVKVGDSIPTPNPLPNTPIVDYTYTVDPANPNGASKSYTGNTVYTQINSAIIDTTKTVDKAFATLGDTLTYTLNLKNNGNATANNVVVTDAIPQGATFVAGSVVGATGTPPTLTLANPIAPGDSATVSFQVKVDSVLPQTNPIPNTATTNYTFTVDPQNPDGGSGSSISNKVTTQINAPIININKAVDKQYADIGEILTYTLTLHNIGNTSANQVVITDAVPTGTTFVPNSVVGATGVPPTLSLSNPIAPDNIAVVSYQVKVGESIPTPNPIINTAAAKFAYTVDPSSPNDASGDATSNTVSTLVRHADVNVVKAVDKAYAKPGDVLTYTFTLTNTGNISANNVVIKDAVPSGTTFVAGSVTGATGAPPTLTLTNPIAVDGVAVVTFKAIVNGVPTINPIPNVALLSYNYTVDPSEPNGKPQTKQSNIVTTQISVATLSVTKTVDKHTSYINDKISYKLAVTNTGNVSANNVVITDILPNGVSLTPGSLTVSVPFTGDLSSGIKLTNAVAPGQTVNISFQVNVTAMPNPNPIINYATANYTYTVDPQNPNGETGVVTSNKVCTLVFRYNFAQQLNNITQSVALEETALAAIANAEGAKIQKMLALGNVSAEDLLCLNQSVKDMMDSIAMLETIISQKLNLFACQINGCSN